jgi:hypothetical protein
MMKRSFQSASPPERERAHRLGRGPDRGELRDGRYGYGLQLPQLAAEYSLSSRTAGAIAAGSFAAYCLAALAGQQLIEWRGARVVLWLAAALAASGAVLVALSWSTPTLALGVLVAGSAAGAASPAMVVAVGATVREPLVARAQAVVNAGTGAGVALVGAAVLAAPRPGGRSGSARLPPPCSPPRRPTDARLGRRTPRDPDRSSGVEKPVAERAPARRCCAPFSPPLSPGSAAQPCGPSGAT